MCYNEHIKLLCEMYCSIYQSTMRSLAHMLPQVLSVVAFQYLWQWHFSALTICD